MKRGGLVILCCFPLFVNAQIITTIAGNGSGGDGTLAITASINDPVGMVFDHSGNMYFTEVLGYKVRKINTLGIITTIAGTGSAGYSGDSGLATLAELNEPTGITIDTSGNLYIADVANHAVRKIDVSTGIITTICGNGTAGFSGDGGPASSAVLNAPGDVQFDLNGNLYISCLGSIRKINTSGIISTVAGTGFTYGDSGDGGLATNAEIEPCNILIDKFGNIYMTDDQHDVIREVNISSGIISRIAGDSSLYIYNGDGIPAINAYIDPEWSAMALGNNQLLYFGDRVNNRVRMIDSSGIIHTVAGNGVPGSIGDGNLADSAEVDWPAGVAFDQCGNLYIAQIDEPRIRKVLFDSLSITPIPTLNISATTSDTVCSGTIVTINATTAGGGSVSTFYNWYVNGVSVSTSGSSYSYMPANGDSIRCAITSFNPCSSPGTASSNTIDMVVESFIIPAITITSNATAAIGSIVTVNATVTDAGSSYNINWYDNGVLFTTTTVPVVTYTKVAETDVITATVVSASAGCYDSTTSGADTVMANLGIHNVGIQSLDVYPNPVNNKVHIDGDAVSYKIRSIVGTTLLQGNLAGRENSIDISSFMPGIYMLEIMNNEGQKTVVKIIKQ